MLCIFLKPSARRIIFSRVGLRKTHITHNTHSFDGNELPESRPLLATAVADLQALRYAARLDAEHAVLHARQGLAERSLAPDLILAADQYIGLSVADQREQIAGRGGRALVLFPPHGDQRAPS